MHAGKTRGIFPVLMASATRIPSISMIVSLLIMDLIVASVDLFLK
jgi:hypothetical protein